jgi:hypothetical protein
MYGIVLMVAMASGGQAADSCGWCAAGWGYGWDCWDCCRPRCGCCGYVIPGLAGYGYGTGAAKLSAEEQKKWDDYVASLDSENDRKDVGKLWSRADLGARRQLIAKIPEPMKPEVEKKTIEKPKPLSAEEIKRWGEYVSTLKGEKKKEAEESWRKADLEGKRKLLSTVPDKD